MIGILGEDSSDVDTLKVIVRRLRRDERTRICGKGYNGGGELLKKGAAQLRSFAERGCTHFIVCHDADGPDPKPKYAEVSKRVVEPADLAERFCITIPVQELEAWLLADIEAVSHIWKSWRPDAIEYPEHIDSPKEYLRRLSRGSKNRPRYSHAVHNQPLARHIDLAEVSRKCRSFRPLEAFVVHTLTDVGR